MMEAKTSGFQFTNPKIKNMFFQVNENFNSGKYEGMPIVYDITVSDKKEESASVALQINVGIKDGDTPFYLELVNWAEFRWTNEVGEYSEKLLRQNAVVLLMSYARPIIAHMVGDAGFKPFNLPFLNVKEETENRN